MNAHQLLIAALFIGVVVGIALIVFNGNSRRLRRDRTEAIAHNKQLQAEIAAAQREQAFSRRCYEGALTELALHDAKIRDLERRLSLTQAGELASDHEVARLEGRVSDLVVSYQSLALSAQRVRLDRDRLVIFVSSIAAYPQTRSDERSIAGLRAEAKGLLDSLEADVPANMQTPPSAGQDGILGSAGQDIIITPPAAGGAQ